MIEYAHDLDASTFQSTTHRFTVQEHNSETHTIDEIDCYLKVCFVGDVHSGEFPHLEVGEICRIDLTISNKTKNMRALEIATLIINQFISDGGHVRTAIKVMEFQKDNPIYVITDDATDPCGSVYAYIAHYLQEFK